jgi:serine/threonine-protein kinase HipA
MTAREQYFATLALSVMVRNGDAHLKNFGILYNQPRSAVSLAPVYDVVTTTAYITNEKIYSVSPPSGNPENKQTGLPGRAG